MEPPHAHWVDHDHSDQQLNSVFTMFSQLQAIEALAPPPPYKAHHNHSHERLNPMYISVRQQRPRFPSSPSRPDSGYHSRSRRNLRVVNTTSTPPSIPRSTSILDGLFPQDEESRALAARRAEECASSSGWEADSESEEGSFRRIGEQDEKKMQEFLRAYPSKNNKNGNNNNNLFSRGLRRVRQCIGAAVLATGRKISGNCGRVGGLDGEVGDKNGRSGGRRDGDEESAFGKAVKRIKRSTLFWRSEPVKLRPAKVRMLLD